MISLVTTDITGSGETTAPPFACLERPMGYDGKPIGPDLTIVTVVLQYGVFPTLVYICIKKGDTSGWNARILSV